LKEPGAKASGFFVIENIINHTLRPDQFIRKVSTDFSVNQQGKPGF
jgi:hypothetical protein